MNEEISRKLAVLLHADIVGSTGLVRLDETLAHNRMQDAFKRFATVISSHGGIAHEIRGDALVAEFSRASDAVAAAVEFQATNSSVNLELSGDIHPIVRVGIAIGEVLIADNTVTGEGIVLAQRLEQIAEPAGICIQDAAYQTIPKRLPFLFESMGERQLKGFDELVKVYRVGQDATDSSAAPSPTRLQNISPTEWPDRPSIAVLPFTNMSGDLEQEYFSDGITEDIITELSRFRELFVISRNSSFMFKQQTVDIREVATKLGVRYVVEGSVRKAGNRVRITAQLLETEDGSHLWAERYDRELEDIFDVQDDVVRSISGVLPGRVTEAVAEVRRHHPTKNLTAYDYLMRANHVLNRRGDNIKSAIELYQNAIKLDSECAAAFAGIAVAEGMAVWDLSYYDDSPLERAYEAGKQAIQLDSSDYRSQSAFGEALRQLGHHDRARQHLQRATKLNPNSARVLGYWAMLQAYNGDPQGAIDTYNHAALLDPLSADNLRLEILAESYYNLHEYEKSLAALESMLKLPIFYTHQQMAICYAQLGDMDACKRSMKKYREELPESYNEQLLFESHLRLCARQEDRDHWTQGYRLTGMNI
ncbi:MAG: adenylate cyclase [Parasphingorhabdus sp.]|jgi:adenylate cyclase